MIDAKVLALTPEQLEISPGAGAFGVFFVLAIAMVLLVMNMSKHLRKVDRYRVEAEVRKEFEEEQAREAEQAAQDPAGGDGVERSGDTENPPEAPEA